nr:hypothetical protein [uncultured Campylobacter sp.]
MMQIIARDRALYRKIRIMRKFQVARIGRGIENGGGARQRKFI